MLQWQNEPARLSIRCEILCGQTSTVRLSAMAATHGEKTLGELVALFRCSKCGKRAAAVDLLPYGDRREVFPVAGSATV